MEIAGKPIIEYIIGQMERIYNLSDIIIVTNHKFAQHFYDWQQSFKCTKPIKILDDMTTTEENRLGAIGDIQFTIETENIDEDVLIFAGDNFFTFDLLDFVAYYNSIGKDCVVAKEVYDTQKLKSFAVATLSHDGKITALVEKPEQPQGNTAIFAGYIYTRETVARFSRYLQEGNMHDAPGYFLQWLYNQTDVYAYSIDGEIFDIGTKDALDYVDRMMTQNDPRKNSSTVC